jgi:hypothetical protein
MEWVAKITTSKILLPQMPVATASSLRAFNAAWPNKMDDEKHDRQK